MDRGYVEAIIKDYIKANLKIEVEEVYDGRFSTNQSLYIYLKLGGDTLGSISIEDSNNAISFNAYTNQHIFLDGGE